MARFRSPYTSCRLSLAHGSDVQSCTKSKGCHGNIFTYLMIICKVKPYNFHSMVTTYHKHCEVLGPGIHTIVVQLVPMGGAAGHDAHQNCYIPVCMLLEY